MESKLWTDGKRYPFFAEDDNDNKFQCDITMTGNKVLMNVTNMQHEFSWECKGEINDKAIIAVIDDYDNTHDGTFKEEDFELSYRGGNWKCKHIKEEEEVKMETISDPSKLGGTISNEAII